MGVMYGAVWAHIVLLPEVEEARRARIARWEQERSSGRLKQGTDYCQPTNIGALVPPTIGFQIYLPRKSLADLSWSMLCRRLSISAQQPGALLNKISDTT